MIRTAFLVLVLATAALPHTASWARADDAAFGKAAETLVGDMTNRLITVLKKEDRIATREQPFKQIFADHFAVEPIAIFAMGRYWRRADETQKSTYLALFSDYIVLTYAARFADYAGEPVKIAGSRVNPGKPDALVRSEVMLPGGEKPVQVDWRVRAPDGGEMRIYDVVVDGLSMSQAQRSDFGSVASGRGIDGLIEVMRAKIAALRGR